MKIYNFFDEELTVSSEEYENTDNIREKVYKKYKITDYNLIKINNKYVLFTNNDKSDTEHGNTFLLQAKTENPEIKPFKLKPKNKSNIEYINSLTDEDKQNILLNIEEYVNYNLFKKDTFP
ncbi:hypothetical protein NUSPORA_00198 [Nucleospora cyclopteri]